MTGDARNLREQIVEALRQATDDGADRTEDYADAVLEVIDDLTADESSALATDHLNAAIRLGDGGRDGARLLADTKWGAEIACSTLREIEVKLVGDLNAGTYLAAWEKITARDIRETIWHLYDFYDDRKENDGRAAD